MHRIRVSSCVPSIFALAFLLVGCDSGGGSAADVVPGGLDTAAPETTAPETRAEETRAADLPAEDVPPGDDVPPGLDVPPGEETVEPPVCEGPGITGRVVQVDGSPIGGAKLFLCGVVNGSETCNPRTADDQGIFSFQTLEPGYTHLEVNATLAGVQLGTQFAGYSLGVDLSGPECLDMGQIVLQELSGGDAVVTAVGGTVQIGSLTLEFPPGCPVFPDFSDQGDVGGAMVEVAAAYWAPDGAVLAAAFHPFKAHCPAGVTVRVDGSVGLAAPTLLYNDLDHGGALEAGAMMPDGEGWVLAEAVPDLTWIWVVD